MSIPVAKADGQVVLLGQELDDPGGKSGSVGFAYALILTAGALVMALWCCNQARPSTPPQRVVFRDGSPSHRLGGSQTEAQLFIYAENELFEMNMDQLRQRCRDLHMACGGHKAQLVTDLLIAQEATLNAQDRRGNVRYPRPLAE